MSVKKEPSGRRSVQVEVEVKGTPEQVWQAIATGPGITAWFVPTQMDGRVGGQLACDFGGGMVSDATITAWQPPHRFTAESRTAVPGGPPMATEWTIEARAGGMCMVRVVHSLFASTDEWDGQIESVEQGWPAFFRVLRLYLERHAGQPSGSALMMAMGKDSPDEMWAVLTRALGVPHPRAGQRVRVEAPGAAPLVATVDSVEEVDHGHGMTLLTTDPAPGALLVGAVSCMGMHMATLQLYLYGPRAAAAARDQPHWQDWLGRLFPAEQAAPPG